MRFKSKQPKIAGALQEGITSKQAHITSITIGDYCCGCKLQIVSIHINIMMIMKWLAQLTTMMLSHVWAPPGTSVATTKTLVTKTYSDNLLLRPLLLL